MAEITESTLEVLARDAQHVGVVVDHDLPAADESAERAKALLNALDLGIEAVGLGV